MERLAQAQAPAPEPSEVEESTPAPSTPSEAEPVEASRPVIALVPDPAPDRVFDQDDPDAGTDDDEEDGSSSESSSVDAAVDEPDLDEAVLDEAVLEDAVVEEVVEVVVDEPVVDEVVIEDRPGGGDALEEETAAIDDRDGTEDPAESAEPARRPIPRPIPSAGLSEGPILDPETLPNAAAADTTPFELPRVIAIANQKGGVGKTTTAVNLGAALAELEFRVLVLDLDPQGNATTGLGINPRDVEGSVYDVLLNDVALEDIVEPTTLRNLFVAPATIDLAGAEIELVPTMSRELRLKRSIDQVRPDYDIVLIDCPPSLGLLTVNGLAAADDVIVPIQCEYYALEGLGQLLRNVGLVQANLNQSLDVRGIILTMYDARTKLADQVESEVRNYFGPKVYRTVVPRTVRLSEAPSFGQPIIVFDSTSRGASAYRELAKEVSRGATKRAR
jgi:chromosome partitioning protein